MLIKVDHPDGLETEVLTEKLLKSKYIEFIEKYK